MDPNACFRIPVPVVHFELSTVQWSSRCALLDLVSFYRVRAVG